MLFTNLQNRKNFTLQTLSEILFSLPVAMYFPKNHFLPDEFDTKISSLNAAGLIERWKLNYLPPLPEAFVSKHPKKLKLEQLLGGIYIFLGGCLMAFVSFLVEFSIRNNM